MIPPRLSSPLLAGLPGVRHAFFTRQGGVSTGLYQSLNVGRGSGDLADHVEENRRRVTAAFDAPLERLRTCHQIHSARVVVAAGPAGEDVRPEADGLVTADRGLVCGVLSADCAPVLIADPGAGIVGAVHAGWRGALEGVLEAAVRAMTTLGARREHMSAAVGPCIGPDAYEVGPEFLERFTARSAGSDRFFAAAPAPGKRLFDLPGFVLDLLAGAGVGQAEWIGRDTLSEEALFFSNRRAFRRGEGDYGRLISAIMLEA